MIKIFYCLFKQAGLLLLTQGFTQFKWEEEVQQLNLPYFNLGEFLLNKTKYFRLRQSDADFMF